MKKIILIISICLSFSLCLAQEQLTFQGSDRLKWVKSYSVDLCKTDLNGEYFAIIEIELHLENVKFECDYIQSDYTTFNKESGIYTLFVAPCKAKSQKSIKVFHQDYSSIEIPINQDINGEKLKGKQCYYIKINAPEKDVNKDKEYLAINTNIEGFNIKVQQVGEPIADSHYVEGKSYEENLTRGATYKIEISKKGYVTDSRTITMSGIQNISIELKPINGRLVISKDREAEVYINDENMGTGSTYELVPGNYFVYTKLAGYTSDIQHVHLTMDGAYLKMGMAGSISILEPTEANISITCLSSYDCLRPNSSKFNSNSKDGLLGNYTLTISKDDYETITDRITISPNANIEKYYHLKPLKHRYTYFSLLGSINLTDYKNIYSPIGISFGVMRKAGWYMNLKTSFFFWQKSIYQIENQISPSKANESKLQEKKGVNSFDITTGLLVNMTPKQSMYWYVGGGYGAYEFDSDVFKYNLIHGGDIESGFLFRVGRKRHCSFVMSIGYNLFINKDYKLHNAQISLGWGFDKGVKR